VGCSYVCEDCFDTVCDKVSTKGERGLRVGEGSEVDVERFFKLI
jgi:hypothetical protein